MPAQRRYTRRYTTASGMTLPELLVTLTLFSLLTTLIFAGLDFVNRSTITLRAEATRQQQYQQLNTSLHSLLTHMTASQNTGAQDFRGDSEQWTGRSLYPLALPPGRTAAFRLQLRQEQGQTHLYYQNNTPPGADNPDADNDRGIQSIFATDTPLSSDWLMAGWPEAIAPRFRYLHWDNTWQDNWQSSGAALLPQAICLCSPQLPPYLFQMRGRITAPIRRPSINEIIKSL